jgi:hypothetical protein
LFAVTRIELRQAAAAHALVDNIRLSKAAIMFASELNENHIGHDLTISVSGILTGGIIEEIGSFGGMVSVQMEGTVFNLDAGMPVTLRILDIRQQLLSEPDAAQRKVLYARMEKQYARA